MQFTNHEGHSTAFGIRCVSWGLYHHPLAAIIPVKSIGLAGTCMLNILFMCGLRQGAAEA